MTNNIEYISLGPDCNSSIAVRNLGLRERAYPFDWTVTSANAILSILDNDFEGYHTDVHMNWNGWVKNRYEVEFPNDFTKDCGDDWVNQHPEMIEKYNRRIQRFRDLMNADNPLVILLGHPMQDVLRIKQKIQEKYNRSNIYYIVKSSEAVEDENVFHMFEPDAAFDSAQWNDSELWRPTVERVKKLIEDKFTEYSSGQSPDLPSTNPEIQS